MWLRIRHQRIPPTYSEYSYSSNSDGTDGVRTTITASGAIVERWLNHICSAQQRLSHHDIVSFSIKQGSTDGIQLRHFHRGIGRFHRGIVRFNATHRSKDSRVVSFSIKHRSRDSIQQRRLHRSIVTFTESRVVTVLQLGLGNHCLLFQLCHADYIPLSLHAFLANPGFEFVGFEIQQQAMRLYHDRALVVHNMTDLGLLAEDWIDLHPIELQDLTFDEMEVDWIVPPMVETSDYSRRVLTEDEVLYASMDSIFTADLGRRLCLDGNYIRRDWGWYFFID